VEQFNRANSLLKAQKSKEAIKYLQKAIVDYPKFVSAHIGLGLAYVDQDDIGRAMTEFETAAKLDDKFPRSFLNLGLLALQRQDFATAQSELQKAASIRPNARTLSALAYAQNGAHEYQHALETAKGVHAMEHRGMANVHYAAASAAMALNDLESMERELSFFLNEDPTNAYAPTARQNLAALTHNKAVRAANADGPPQATNIPASQGLQTFPNSERLKAELSALGDESEGGSCEDCDTLAEAGTATEGGNSGAASDVPPRLSNRGAWTIRKRVEEVTLFFAASSHGHLVNDLEASDIQIRDNNKPPEKALQFAPQSKLPLRLALLIDTSGSVHDRFLFEKRAATNFVEKMLNSTTDLGFIAGFSHETSVTQDFSSEPGELAKGIEKLTNGGGTALFDAVSFACWKLAQYPERERVARVLVILSDGEDNSSHTSLKQSIQVVEGTGVTVYTVSTRGARVDKSDADKVLELLAERSGGEAMFPDEMRTLGKSFDKLHGAIRSRYFVAYKPADFQPNGSYRTISIIAEKNGKPLHVRARKGYYARLETIRH
jgi:Ca-activated chloride channel family protein